MLGQCRAVAEPADVADIGQDGGGRGRVGKAHCQLLAKKVLVTDVGRHPLAAQRQGRRAQRPAPEVAQRDVHQFGEPAKAGRDELAKGHQVVFVVAVAGLARLAGYQRHHRVGVTLVMAAQRHAHQRGGAVRPAEVPAQRRPVAGHQRVELIGQQRHCRLGRHHQVGLGRQQGLRHPGQRGGQVLGGKFFVLRHVRLQQRHGQAAGRGGEVGRAAPGAPGRRQAQHHGHHPQRLAQRQVPSRAPASRRARQGPGTGPWRWHPAGQPPGQARHQRAQRVHPHPRQQQRQRPVQLGVAGGTPGETGEEHATRQLGRQPGGGKTAGILSRPATAAVRHPGHHAGQVQRQRRRQQRHRRHRQRRRHLAITVQADEQPPTGRAQPAAAEGPAQ